MDNSELDKNYLFTILHIIYHVKIISIFHCINFLHIGYQNFHGYDPCLKNFRFRYSIP